MKSSGSNKSKICINIDSRYYRVQFDDWLAGGRIQYKEKVYHWSAQDSNYGFGWEIEPISEEDWDEIRENQINEIFLLIKKSLSKHITEYKCRLHNTL